MVLTLYYFIILEEGIGSNFSRFGGEICHLESLQSCDKLSSILRMGSPTLMDNGLEIGLCATLP